ncbi:hypothetical protein B566_EDAN014807 [Ephemera danica]|nr:hypothetical protein B566_EDAN014807 [Ephemera danica]
MWLANIFAVVTFVIIPCNSFFNLENLIPWSTNNKSPKFVRSWHFVEAFVRILLSWNDARDYCHLYNMELISKGLLKTSHWVGLNKLGTLIPSSNRSLGLMLNVLSTINKFKGNCLAYTSSLSSDFRILPLECKIPRNFICKLPAHCL